MPAIHSNEEVEAGSPRDSGAVTTVRLQSVAHRASQNRSYMFLQPLKRESPAAAVLITSQGLFIESEHLWKRNVQHIRRPASIPFTYPPITSFFA